MDKEFYEKARAILLKDRERPHEERWQSMIDAGFIDANGKVLLKARMPRDPALGPDPNFDDDEDIEEAQTRPEA